MPLGDRFQATAWQFLGSDRKVSREEARRTHVNHHANLLANSARIGWQHEGDGIQSKDTSARAWDVKRRYLTETVTHRKIQPRRTIGSLWPTRNRRYPVWFRVRQTRP